MTDNWISNSMRMNEDSQKQKLKENKESLRCIRVSENEVSKALLMVAEGLYREECEVIKSKDSLIFFCDKKPGFQMRLVDQARVMLSNYYKIKKFLKA